MRRTLKLAAGLALSVTAVFGSPASASAAEDPIYNVLTAEDPIHTAIAEATLNLERSTGITDPSAGK